MNLLLFQVFSLYYVSFWQTNKKYVARLFYLKSRILSVCYDGEAANIGGYGSASLTGRQVLTGTAAAQPVQLFAHP